MWPRSQLCMFGAQDADINYPNNAHTRTCRFVCRYNHIDGRREAARCTQTLGACSCAAVEAAFCARNLLTFASESCPVRRLRSALNTANAQQQKNQRHLPFTLLELRRRRSSLAGANANTIVGRRWAFAIRTCRVFLPPPEANRMANCMQNASPPATCIRADTELMRVHAQYV